MILVILAHRSSTHIWTSNC